MRIMTVRAKEELIENLDLQAKKLGITRNALILVILDNWIKCNDKEETEKQ